MKIINKFVYIHFNENILLKSMISVLNKYEARILQASKPKTQSAELIKKTVRTLAFRGLKDTNLRG